ncbi:methionine adenosyltransferase [Ruficoccus sp. ZRK36]|uniref:methionine adenosyltransferase n=1 Tax=Ruficoccus sp. ZRK36 TaxID=2866311 RepID=UPI001C737F9E|nr:methionine adenosyltransferase [Ruficoccus sp. ZRK36]QYY34700.1 methionine adenosyltransferase [Ruficoccus sp. ZRK36]
MSKSFIFSSESVGEGHPDKVADYISDSILDACLSGDPKSRVACETLVKSNCVFVAGEITTKSKFNYEDVVRQAIRDIGYINSRDDAVFHADEVFITNCLTSQSPDIKQGVDAAAAEGKDTAEQGAGDQGIMFGYACNQTEELMPAPIMYAHRLLREMAVQRKDVGVEWLRPDVKSQVAVEYVDGQIKDIRNVVISTQHTEDVKHSTIREFCIEEVIKKVLPAELLTDKTEFLINPTGKFVVGGPQGDSGLTGRKIIVDTYGGWARHGGGAFSGKDPSKVDRSAAYFCRWVAKNIVAAGLADECELQVAYAIGYPYPTSIHVDTFGSAKDGLSDAEISAAAQKVFSFKPAEIVGQLDLLRPIYRQSTNYGHFAKADLPWEDISKAAELKAAVCVNA